jgi:Holliday junction resolvase
VRGLPLSTYEKGRRFEYRVLHDLRGKGFLAFRFPGSKPFDIFAIDRSGRVYIVECKIRRADFREEDANALRLVRQRYNVTTLLAYNDGGKIKYEEVKG